MTSRLGRDYVPTFWQLFAYDPFRTGVGFGSVTTQGGSPITQLRASNSIGYFTPGCYSYQCKGFFAQAMYALGENASGAANSDDGKVAGVRVGYGAAQWDVSAGQTKTWNTAIGDFTQTVIGGAYDNDAFRLMVLAGEHKTGRPVAALNNSTKAPFWQVGAYIYVGPGYIPVAYTRVKPCRRTAAPTRSPSATSTTCRSALRSTRPMRTSQQQGNGPSGQHRRRFRSDTTARQQLVRHRPGYPQNFSP